jgi:predicted transcriptional regulator
MKVESVSSDISYVDDRIKKTVTKTYVDEKTNKEYQITEKYFYEIYDKKGNIKTEHQPSVDKKV